MISDVLSKAIEQIEQYQTEIPDAYSAPEIKTEIEAVKAAMRSLQEKLDNPSGFEDPGQSSRSGTD